MLPLTFPIWLGGFWFLFFTEKGKIFRVLGWACVVTFTVILVLNPRVYYLWPAFPILLAGGSVLWESWLERPSSPLGQVCISRIDDFARRVR